jgi:acetyl esterase
MTPDRRRFMALTGITALGGLTGSASGTLIRSADMTQANAQEQDLPKPVRADEPTESVQELLDTLAEKNVPHLYELSTKEARKLYEKFFIVPPQEEVGKVENRMISGPNGEIPIRIYWPKESRFDCPMPVSVYFHGGGFVLGGLDTHDSVARSLTNASEGIVVSVDYRLAPEHPFPAAVEDAYAATKWVAHNADSIGADSDRIAVTGESAGGDLTAAMTLLSAQRSGPTFVYQLPIYPVTTFAGGANVPGTFTILSKKTEQQLPRRYLVPKDFPWFVKRFFPAKLNKYNITVSPLLADEKLLKKAPPATIVTTGFGPLGDQGYLYAKHLHDAGVEAEITHYEAMIHDFFNMEYLPDPYPDIPTGGKAKQKTGETLRTAFEDTG